MAHPQRIAVADLGTNSTRLLVADVDPEGRLRELERRTEVTRLGERVDATGRLADAAIDRVLTTLGRYRQIADELEAAHAVGVATSAVREAANGGELQRLVRERYGFDVRAIDGSEEARLTFLGATAGRAAREQLLVVDVGGGSTEYVVGAPGEAPRFHASTLLGSVRQTERHLASDPPQPDELAALTEAARATIAAAVPAEVRARPAAGIAVAGTPTSLAAISQRLEPYDRARVHGFVLPLGECERILALLAAIPLEKRRDVPGLHPDRAPTIVAGTAILVESMRAFALDAVEVSESDILQGAALEALARG